MKEELLNQFNFNPKFTPIDIIDTLIVAALIYSFLLFFRRTRSHLLLYGIAITFGLYFFAKLAHLQLTLFILHTFVGASIIVLAIIFQAEIRKYLEVLGLIGTRQFKVGPLAPVSPVATEIVLACLEMKKDKVGALIVFQGLDSLDGFVDGGISLDGVISEEVLLSIFSPETGGHDGAVLIKNNRISKFAVQLPLSKTLRS